MGGWTIIISFIVFAGICAGVVVGLPPMKDQIVWKSSIVLTLVCCWLMYFCVDFRWAITYMAQLNPLVQPIRTFGPGGGGHSG